MAIELLNIDCMEYMRTVPDKYFDLAIVDPPYGIDINKSGRLGHYGGKGKKWDQNTPDDQYFKELERISTNQIIWGANYFNMPPTRGFIIWDKQQPENVSFASCEFAWTSFDMSARTYYQRPQNADHYRIHPTQKPRALYDWLLSKYSHPEARIIDTHLGSGSSAIAAYYFGVSQFVGCELDPDYYKAALSRFNTETAQESLF